MDKINKLQAVIDELRLESRKIEYNWYFTFLSFICLIIV